jgi:5-hydroxyisourate hydrolase-like protein (transthyretin family)
VLDTALGRPAAGVLIGLQRAAEGSGGAAWDTIGEARTNTDGRVPNLLPPGNYLAQGACLEHLMLTLRSCIVARPLFTS